MTPTEIAAGLPARHGPRPRIGPMVPHEELDQNGPPELVDLTPLGGPGLSH